MAQLGKLRRKLALVEERLFRLCRRHDEQERRPRVILPVVAERVALSEPMRIHRRRVRPRSHVRRRELLGERPVGLVDVLLRGERQRGEEDQAGGDVQAHTCRRRKGYTTIWRVKRTAGGRRAAGLGSSSMPCAYRSSRSTAPRRSPNYWRRDGWLAHLRVGPTIHSVKQRSAACAGRRASREKTIRMFGCSLERALTMLGGTAMRSLYMLATGLLGTGLMVSATFAQTPPPIAAGAACDGRLLRNQGPRQLSLFRKPEGSRRTAVDEGAGRVRRHRAGPHSGTRRDFWRDCANSTRRSTTTWVMCGAARVIAISTCKRLAGQGVDKLYVRAGLTGAERLLVDPATISLAPENQGKGPSTIQNVAISGDGRYVAVGYHAGRSGARRRTPRD